MIWLTAWAVASQDAALRARPGPARVPDKGAARVDRIREKRAWRQTSDVRAHLEWDARRLDSPWLHRPMKHMRYCRAAMAEALGSGLEAGRQ